MRLSSRKTVGKMTSAMSPIMPMMGSHERGRGPASTGNLSRAALRQGGGGGRGSFSACLAGVQNHPHAPLLGEGGKEKKREEGRKELRGAATKLGKKRQAQKTESERDPKFLKPLSLRYENKNFRAIGFAENKKARALKWVLKSLVLACN